jgi:hypothetical protein
VKITNCKIQQEMAAPDAAIPEEGYVKNLLERRGRVAY